MPDDVTADSEQLTPPHIATWRGEFTGRNLSASLNAAVVLYLLEMIITLSVVALVYSGPLAVHLPMVVGAALLGNAVLVAIVSAFSSYGGSMAVTQDTPAVLLAGAAASITTASTVGPDQLLPTVAVLLFGATLVTGATFLVLGILRLGRFIRFLPFPVLGGFLAGTGWLLLSGGVSVATRNDVSWRMFGWDSMARWLPAVALGALMLAVVRRTGRPELLAAIVGAGVVVFYAVTSLGGRSPATLGDGGWLLGPFPDDVGWSFPVPTSSWSSIDWSALVEAIPGALPAVFLGVIGLLLNTSSLELLTKSDFDLDRELRVAGTANLASGVLGGLVGYHGTSVSSLSHGLGRGRRLPGLMVSAMIVATVVFGTALVSYIPRLVLGGLLAYVGLSLLYEWLVAARQSMRTAEYAIIVGILVAIIATDFVWGVVIGSILTVMLFIADYSRIDVVRHRLTGETARSRVTRSVAQTDILRQHGERIGVYTLQGFIFFGTATTLLAELRSRITDVDQPALRFVVVDFRQVTGIDSTAVLSFNRLLNLTSASGISLVMTGLTTEHRSQLERGGLQGRRADGSTETPQLHRLADLDAGLEWCEEQLLADAGDHRRAAPGLQALIPDPVGLADLLARLERLDLVPGDRLIVEGDLSRELYLIESGSFTVGLDGAGENVRLQATRGAQIFGELGFFLGTPRTATVVCDAPAVVYRLTSEAWAQIQIECPEIALSLHAAVIGALGETVAHLSLVVGALQGR